MDGGSVLKEYLLGYDKSKMATPSRKLKPVQLDVWSIRERLALACSVLRSGDQNWVSVSRAIKPFGEANRPPDWFSQKNCALQYSDLLEKVETPKRKRGERGEIETPGNQIARNLTCDRIEELKRLVQDEQQRYKQLKREVELIKSGQQDDKLKDVWDDLQMQKKAAEEAAAAVKQKSLEEAMTQAHTAASSKLLSKTVGSVPPKAVKKPQPKQLRLITKETAISDQDDSTMDSIPDPVSIEIGDDSCSSPAVQISTTTVTTTTSAATSSSSSLSLLSTSSSSSSSQPEDAKSNTPQSPLLSHLLKSKPKLTEGATPSQQPTPSSEDTENSSSSSSATITTEMPDTTMLSMQPASPTQKVQTTPASVTATTDLQIPRIEVKQEPVDVEEIKIEEKQSSPVAVSVTVSKATVTEAPSGVTSTAASKTEVPSSPSLGAPTLSKLLCNPVASPLTAKLPEVKQSPAPVEQPLVTETPAETEPKAPVKTATPEPEVKEEKTSTKDDYQAQAVCKDTTPTKLSSKPEQESKEASVPPSPTCTKTSVSSSSVCVDEDVSFKEEPASPASSIVSNVSETAAPKVTKAKRGRPRGSRRSMRVTRRSVNDETGSKQSEQETSDDETVHESDDGLLNSSAAKLNFSLPAESVPNSPASMSQCSDSEDEKAYKVWKKSIMLVWRAAANHKYANVFLHPVTNDIAPGYTSVVFRPMDLLAIKKNVENGVIRTTSEFQRDMMLMFTNAIMYNSSDHNVHHMAGEMYNDVMMHIEQYVNTQMMVQTEPKMLRPSRRSDAPSDKEEDIRRRRTSSDQHHILDSGGKLKKRKTRSDDN